MIGCEYRIQITGSIFANAFPRKFTNSTSLGIFIRTYQNGTPVVAGGCVARECWDGVLEVDEIRISTLM